MFFEKNMTKERANEIYDILVQECRAPDEEHDRTYFVLTQTKEKITEWRFCGALGFGGKFWRNCGKIYVTCYLEDETPERKAMIEAANKRLAAL